MQKLATLRELGSGQHPSIPNDDVPLWADGSNVIYKKDAVTPVPGQFIMFPKPELAKVSGVVELLVDGVQNLFFGTLTALYRWKTGDVAATDVTRAAGAYVGTSEETWSIVAWGEDVAATNFIDKVQVWNKASAANFVDLDTVSDLSTDFRCEILDVEGPFLFGYSYKDTGFDNNEAFLWCDEDDRTVFTATATNLAGDLTIRNLNSPIKCVVELGQFKAVYGLNQLHVVSFIGAPLVFRRDHLMNEIGAFGKASVVSVDKMNYGIGPKGLFETDGTQSNYIDTPAIHDFIYDNINKDAAFKAVVWADTANSMIYFSYPSSAASENDTTVGFNYKNRTFSLPEFFRTAASSAAVFDFPITADANGSVYQQGVAGFAPSASDKPMTLVADTVLKLGYGEGGYGELGYGGERIDLVG